MAGQSHPSSGAMSGFIIWYSRRLESAAVAILQIAFVLAIFAVLHAALLVHGLTFKDHPTPACKSHDITRNRP
jgi:hypothetical protein